MESMADAALKIASSVLELVSGDITLQDTEAIANAANSHLAGGGGVDGAIHKAAGADVMAELKEKYPGGCPTGRAVITKAGKLRAKHIIHAVGPVYRGRDSDAKQLAGAYESSLEIASRHKIRSVAFPSISTGVYGYPLEEAANIALKAVSAYLGLHPDIELVRFVLFDEKTYAAYAKALKSLR